MRRSDLEHIIRASGEIADDSEIVIIGSQAILGQFPDAPVRLLVSMETDVYPRNKPQLAEKIDGAIGEGSSFHEQHGYYAQGVGPETALLPKGWEDRLIEVNNQNTGGISGLCLEVHDLAISKLVAARPKDLQFLRELVSHGMVERTTLTKRLAQTQLKNVERQRMQSRLALLFST